MTSYKNALKQTVFRFLFAALAILLCSPSLRADDGAITIELNKLEDTDQGCRPLFLFNNQSGHQLNRFQVELVLFDAKGVHSKQILLDMAPLYEGKKMVASFLLTNLDCDEIGSMLINDLPECENSTGTSLSCLERLEVTSKSDTPLEK